MKKTFLIFILLLGVRGLLAQDVTGPRAEITLNGNWQYQLNGSQSRIPTSGWSVQRDPALPITDGTVSAWYQQTIWIPSSWNQSGRRWFVELEKCGHYCAVYANGQPAIAANGVSGENDSYSQFSPLVAEVTGLLSFGADNTIQVYAHAADSTHSARGVTLDQSACPFSNLNCDALAFQAAANTTEERGWIGIVGDVTLFWRPATYISNVSTVTSVRNETISAIISANGTGSSLSVQGTVYDGGTAVLSLPSEPIVSSSATLEASWTNPVFWGPAPYGQPKLYTLQTELFQNGALIDTSYTQFGFREVWVSGELVYLNGLPLWLAGGFLQKLDDVAYANDPRVLALFLNIVQQSGGNFLQLHWDNFPEWAYQMADQMGMLTIAPFYCNGAVPDQDEIDADDVTYWTDWMEGNTAAWAVAYGNHPSVVGWRPIDVAPTGISQETIYVQLRKVVQANDPSGRPVFDGIGSDPIAWVQFISTTTNQQTCTTDSAFVSALDAATVPLWVRELSGNFSLSCAPSFISTFYGADYTGGGVGLNLELPTLFTTPTFTPSWFSISGVGNRPSGQADLPNFDSRVWTPTAYSSELAGLYQQYFQPSVLNTSPTEGDFQATGLGGAMANSAACLTPSNGLGEPICVLIAQDGSGTAWLVTPWTGAASLLTTAAKQGVTVSAPAPF